MSLLLAEAGMRVAAFDSLAALRASGGHGFAGLVTEADARGLRGLSPAVVPLGLPCVVLAPEPVEAGLAMALLEAGVLETIELPGQAGRLPDAVRAAVSGAGPEAGRGGDALRLTPEEAVFLRQSLARRSLGEIRRELGLEMRPMLELRRAAIAATGAIGLAGALRALLAGCVPAC